MQTSSTQFCRNWQALSQTDLTKLRIIRYKVFVKKHTLRAFLPYIMCEFCLKIHHLHLPAVLRCFTWKMVYWERWVCALVARKWKTSVCNSTACYSRKSLEAVRVLITMLTLLWLKTYTKHHPYFGNYGVCMRQINKQWHCRTRSKDIPIFVEYLFPSGVEIC